MEVILYIAGFYGFFYILGSIIQKIEDYQEREKSKKRDGIAESVLDEYGVNNDIKCETDSILDRLKSDVGHFDGNGLELHYDGKNASRLCPTCKAGYMVRRQGEYGAFLGCSRYPNCKTTRKTGWVNKEAKEDAKNVVSSQFFKDLERAYK